MKFLTVIALVASASAFAVHHDEMKDMEYMPFDQHKKLMQERLEKKSVWVEESKKCVNDAKDKAGLMECHKTMKEERHAMKDTKKKM